MRYLSRCEPIVACTEGLYMDSLLSCHHSASCRNVRVLITRSRCLSSVRPFRSSMERNLRRASDFVIVETEPSVTLVRVRSVEPVTSS